MSKKKRKRKRLRNQNLFFNTNNYNVAVENQSLSLEKLPFHYIYLILMYLEIKDYANLAKTCKRMKQITYQAPINFYSPYNDSIYSIPSYGNNLTLFKTLTKTERIIQENKNRIAKIDNINMVAGVLSSNFTSTFVSTLFAIPGMILSMYCKNETMFFSNVTLAIFYPLGAHAFRVRTQSQGGISDDLRIKLMTQNENLEYLFTHEIEQIDAVKKLTY